MPKNLINICENEARIVKLEEKVSYKDEKMDSILQDNKEVKEDIKQLTVAVTELSNTLKIREEDSYKLDCVENKLIELTATMKTLKYILPLVFTIITIIISAISILIQLKLF
ncbi:hypothetical protein [Methanobrevibacter olleyae]|uniref:Phage-related protein n=1 Tax=Methanobrevibacter olleyae TaxID=294671 RepID=A0A126R203_METOL|nr:hypothetical protein [Methanobrevibacter olleyae]AMK16311.1 phage-related protein [Methanobrevibacter olleyae]